MSGRVLVRVRFLGFWSYSRFWFVFSSCSWSLGVLVRSWSVLVPSLVLVLFMGCWCRSGSVSWVSGCVLGSGLVLSSGSCSGS